MDGHRRIRVEHDRGAVMVELALVLPLLIILLVGIFDFGQFYNGQIAIQAAAREGARALALGEDSAAVEQAVKDAADDQTIEVDQSGCDPSDPDKPATVTVTGSYTFTIPFLEIGQKTYNAKASMRCGL
jgi:Flp pilus assembly protein TadG